MNWKNLIKYIRTTFCIQCETNGGFASISWYFNDSKTGPIHCEGNRVLSVERFRTGDTDTPIQEAKHRLINEAGKNDEITSVEREREIGTPLVSSESSCCARELVPRTYILLEAWTRGSADGLKLLSERILRSSMKVKHVRYTFLFNQQNSLRCWRKFWLGKLFSSLCSRSFQKSPQNIKFFSTEIWSNEISNKVEAILASSRETGKKRMNSEPSRLSFVIWRERRYFCGQFSPHLLFASTSCLRDCYSSSV